MCAVFAVDIVGFTRPDRDDDIRLYLHEQLYEYLRESLRSTPASRGPHASARTAATAR